MLLLLLLLAMDCRSIHHQVRLRMRNSLQLWLGVSIHSHCNKRLLIAWSHGSRGILEVSSSRRWWLVVAKGSRCSTGSRDRHSAYKSREWLLLLWKRWLLLLLMQWSAVRRLDMFRLHTSSSVVLRDLNPMRRSVQTERQRWKRYTKSGCEETNEGDGVYNETATTTAAAEETAKLHVESNGNETHCTALDRQTDRQTNKAWQTGRLTGRKRTRQAE
ncbi:hypothetical protein GQ42DRAFT_91591 [Ramicandelaber brevisporus]|nr:hypothetical protein GQ42DRAFT_91591 [Ramicandelaber brevisporus]